jgi:translation initiation factor IF-1
MNKRIIAGMVMVLAGFIAFANGNAEKLSTVDGALAIAPDENGQARIMLRTADGENVVVDMPIQERQRIRLREEDKIRVSGIYVGVPAGEQAQARILARSVNANGTDYSIEKPIQLTERDRDRIRTCEGERLQTQTQTRTQDQVQLSTGEGSGGTNPGASAKGSGSSGRN